MIMIPFHDKHVNRRQLFGWLFMSYLYAKTFHISVKNISQFLREKKNTLEK